MTIFFVLGVHNLKFSIVLDTSVFVFQGFILFIPISARESSYIYAIEDLTLRCTLTVSDNLKRKTLQRQIIFLKQLAKC